MKLRFIVVAVQFNLLFLGIPSLITQSNCFFIKSDLAHTFSFIVGPRSLTGLRSFSVSIW